MEFFSSYPPLNDFVLTVNLTEFDPTKIPDAIKKAVLCDNQVLFYNNTIVHGADGCLLFSGYALDNGHYIADVAGLAAQCKGDLSGVNAMDARGQWVSLTHRDQKTEIRCDPFGLYPVYYFVRGTIAAVSNRFHLLIQILKSAGLSLSRNQEAALPLLCPYHFGEQLATRETTVRDIFLLPVQDSIVVDNTLQIHNDPVYRNHGLHTQTKDYPELIVEARHGICQDVSTLARNATCFVMLSGGRDSRMVYGALIREGLLDQVHLLTAPHKKDDLRIVCGLTNMFGGTFGDCIFYDRVAGDLEAVIGRYRSFTLGLYNFPQSLCAHYSAVAHPDVVCFGGGGGECYRSFYSNHLKLSESPDWNEASVALQKHFQRVLGNSGIGAGYFQAASDALIAELRSAECETLDESLDWHYLNYRNRFHFGNKNLIFSTGNFQHHPGMQTALLAAARLLNFQQKAAGRVLFDVTAALVSFLPRLDYDIPAKAFSSAVIDQSPFDDLPKNLRIPMDFSDQNYKNGMKRSATSRFQLEPARFTKEQRHAALKRLLVTSFDYLRDDAVLDPYLTEPFREWLVKRVDIPQNVGGVVPLEHRFTASFVGLHDTWRLIAE